MSRCDVYFALLLALFVSLMLFGISGVSVHYAEAWGFYNAESFEFIIAKASVAFFGKSLERDLALKLPTLCISALNCVLMYLYAKKELSRQSDALICAGIFMLLPGIIFSSIVVLKSAFFIAPVLLILILNHYQHRAAKSLCYAISVALCFWDFTFGLVFLGVFFYALRVKNTPLALFCLALFGINASLFASAAFAPGRPEAHTLRLISTIAMLYSPPLFIYYAYTLYNAMAKRANLGVFIAVSVLLLGLFLSLRQSVDIAAFLAPSVVALPSMVGKFFSDMRLRLPKFRLSYTLRFALVLAFLLAQSSAVVFNKIFYHFSTQSHFASGYHIAKELAAALKAKNISNIKVDDARLALRLKFYGIGEKSSNKLVEVDLAKNRRAQIAVEYLGKRTRGYNVVKIK